MPFQGMLVVHTQPKEEHLVNIPAAAQFEMDKSASFVYMQEDLFFLCFMMEYLKSTY